MEEKRNVPKLRFPGFTDPWEQRKLGEVATVTMGQSPNGTFYTDNPNDIILVQGNADLKDGWVCPKVWTTQITKTANAGDLIISVRAPVGAVGKTAFDVVLGGELPELKATSFFTRPCKRRRKMATGRLFRLDRLSIQLVEMSSKIHPFLFPLVLSRERKLGSNFASSTRSSPFISVSVRGSR